ncbi:hypothetical protein DV737_g2961, partial [Chaetothyriales sp. CBS 132003]
MSLGVLQKLYDELSMRAVVESPRDCKILYAQRFIRFAAYGSSTLVLALFLKNLNINEEQIGLFMTLTLLGDVAISLVLTVIADGVGRRRMLALGALSMACSGIVFALVSNFWILLAAAVFGVISPSGNEIGPFRAIEESTLAHLIPKDDRTSILAWYHMCGFAGSSLGILVCGWAVRSLQFNLGWTPLESYRVVFYVYTALGLIKLFLSLCLSSACEPEKKLQYPAPPAQNEPDETRPLLAEDDGGPKKSSQLTSKQLIRFKSILPQLTPESLSIICKLCLLFCIDSFASGLVPMSWMTYFFSKKFRLGEGKLGSIFFVTNILSSMSGLVAASLAKRLGLIKTMVFTHMPASVALALIPVPDNAGIAIALLAFRSSTSSMDQAPRQAFLAAAVLPNERTTVMGIVNVVKTLTGFVDSGRISENYGAEPSSYRKIHRTRSILTPRGRPLSDSRSPQHTPFSQAPTLRNTSKESNVNDHGLKLRLKRSINALRPTSRLSISRRPETHMVNHDVAVELAREQYFASMQEKLVHHRPPAISNPKAARRQQSFPKSVRSHQDKETETMTNCNHQTGETPGPDSKKRSFSTTLQNHLRRAFGVSASPKSSKPLQHPEVPVHYVIEHHDDDDDVPNTNLDHFVVGEEEKSRRQSFYVSPKAEVASLEEVDRFSPTLHPNVSGESLHSNTRSRVTSWTNSTVTASSLSTLQPVLERNRLSIIKEDGGPHQPSSSAGRHLGGIRIFQQPLEGEDENGGRLPAVDSQRLYSALMKRIGEEEVEMEQTRVALNEIHNGKNRLARGLRDPNRSTIRAISNTTVSTQPGAEASQENRTQINPDDVEVGTLDVERATGKARTDNRFPLLEVKEVPRNNTPAPERSSSITKGRTGLLKRISSIDLGSVIGKSEENGKVSASGRKYNPSNIARILRERKSQVLTSRGEGRDKENSVGVEDESPPLSTPGRLQLQLRNGNGRLRKRRSEEAVSKDQTTPKSFNMSLQTKGGEYDESPIERVKQSLSARLSRPFDMDVPPGNRPFDSVYLGNSNNESGKVRGLWSSKRMVSDFLRRRRGGRSSSQDTPTAGGDESETQEKDMTAAFL